MTYQKWPGPQAAAHLTYVRGRIAGFPILEAKGIDEMANLLEKHELHSHKTEVTKWRRRSCELCLLVYLVSVNMSLTQSQMARLCMRRGHYACILHQLKGFTPYPKK
ncbi:hypothetical protein Y1Q_0004066 [Alligator mississippiensis]|uniref:Uncharacterized protein n=1 Tax=Alligator mississippiensis TaxID=8496 RepID=A0A151PI02_ALLMI|nr:hypothetical protein Y1Q_0004066 [Alligator mississippiensis]